MKKISMLLFNKMTSLVIILVCAFSFFSKAQVTIIGAGSYATISAAVAAAIPGDIVEVSPGTYNETVTINKSIHLRGQPGQVLTTIIKAPSTLPLPATQNSNIVTVTGSGVSAEINDLTIAGPGPSGCGSISYGIFVRSGAYANIHDNRISDVRDNPFSGCQNGVGIQVGRQLWGTTGTATITNNIITGYQKNGITVDNTGSNATIVGNTITGAGTTAIIAQNGIQISRGATGSLNGNTVSGNSYHKIGNASDWGSTGILLFQSGAVSLNGGNNLTGNDQNYYAYLPTGAVTLGAEVFGTSSAPLGFGNQIVDLTTQNIDARSCTFGGLAPGAMSMTQLFNLEDFIYHSIDNPEEGFVYIKTNNDYVTINSFDAASGYPDAQIQRGIDAASNGFTVNVQSGSYAKQIATNRNVFGVNGPHQFGLFIDKDNLTIRGYDLTDAPVANASSAAVVFTTGATNNFGYSGIFVQANGVTLEGLKVGNNLNDDPLGSNNKTIEIVGDAFNISKCWINTDIDEGAVYMGRWDAAHTISSYNISQNKFENTLVSINNGVGLSGPRAGRVITNNEFVGVATPYLIGFRGWNGAGPVQGWIVDPVGGAVVTGNLFNTTGVNKYVVARGNAGGYINSELNWSEIWNMNTYGNHVVTLTNYPSFDVRTYVDGAGYPETRRISPMIQENVNIGNTGDVVLVSAGTFEESVLVNKSVTIQGAGQASTFVIPATSNPNCGGAGGGSLCAGASNVFLVQANNVIIHDLTVNGDNPSLTSGIVVGGADLDARNGIITNHTAGVYQNLEVYNVTVKNTYLRGMYASSGGSFNFHNNTVINVKAENASIGMFNYGGSGAFTNNIVSDCNDAISSNHSRGTTYSGNAITNSGSGIHTDNNGDGGGVADIIENNTVSNSPANGYGIFVFAAYRDVIIQNNTITNVEVGLTCAGSYTTATPVFRRNTVNGLMKANSIGVYSTTEIWGYTSGNQHVIFNNNFVQNNVKGFLIASELGYTNTTTANENFISGNTIGVKLVKDYTEVPPTGTFVLNMTCNWWGNWTGPFNAISNPTGTGNTVPGGVPFLPTFSPWLTSGVDNNPAIPGFQPVSNSCQGTPAMLAIYKCGKKNEKKVYICHNGNTICVSNTDLQSHFDHGDKLGNCTQSSQYTEMKGMTNTEESIVLLPMDYKLSNYPNPFSSVTKILVEIPEDSKLSLKVYDVMGREVKTLINESRKAGTIIIEFNATGLSSGVYYAKLEAIANGKVIHKSMKMVKQ